MKKYLFFILIFYRINSFAQFQIVDIKHGGNSSNPSLLTVLDNVTYFVADDSIRGRELWRSDGTLDGTYIVKDINIGLKSSDILKISIFNKNLVFVANDGIHGREIWISDGSEIGTKLLVDIIKDSTSTSISDESFVSFENKFYFTATNGVNGKELWRSDGTEANTKLYWDKFNGPLGANPSIIATLNDRLFLYTNDSIYGRELWSIDGTDTGFHLLKDISKGNSNSDISSFIINNNKMFFSANDHLKGSELWVTDGWSSTFLLKDIYPGIKSSDITFLHTIDSTVLFLANDSMHGLELWQSDGSLNGTKILYDGREGVKGQPNKVNMIGFNGKIIFNFTTDSIGNELFILDKKLNRVFVLDDIYKGNSSSNPKQFTIADSLLYFVATMQNQGAELKSFDGENINSLNEIYPGPRYDVFPNELVYLGNRVLCFVAFDEHFGNEFFILNPKIVVNSYNVSDGRLDIYPNPVDNLLTCEFIGHNQNFLTNSIQILEVNGKLLGSYKFNENGKCYIDFQEFSNGNYILNVLDRNKQIVLSKKIVKI